jgi:predicted aspartyl protease
MGRIVTPVVIANALHPAKEIRCDALVDTGAAGLILPRAWKRRLGALPIARIVAMETADQRHIQGEVCGPVKIQIEGFDTIFNEVIFIDMQPATAATSRCSATSSSNNHARLSTWLVTGWWR